ncbi:WbqC family protein [Hymenobacter sp. DH14]|uniref:WbqC family protein n=1 Tax=Hymenobacter cyanobacteriorum TaxID=2926463 RepID=A0A9X1VHE0_9BACT|nr:WbqC family protein [Hymenobacter cyanobacteriorum]MCI1188896.1 WbqC family protein [Hymenobacter cyanobacteriorum]
MTSNFSAPIQARSSRTVAIMQPYLFPYIGYFQLLAAADCFVVYDDVQFIKGGWINRNRILINGKPFLFTVPLDSPSPNRNICDIDLGTNALWRSKLLQTIAQGYRRAPHFEQVFALVERVLNNSNARTIADLIRVSLVEIVAYLGLNIEIIPTSTQYGNRHLRNQERVLDICRLEQATNYVNAQGGRVLYDKEIFAINNIELNFLVTTMRPYPQGKGEFVPGLSIIDVLMHNTVAETHQLLSSYELD